MIINLGDAPFKAFIKVTYPNGTCTVSLGDKSLTHSGGGTHTFTVNKKGTWTVKATSNAGVVETQNVSLTYVGQVANVTLTGIFYAIKNGVSNVGTWIGVKYADGIRAPRTIGVSGQSGNRYGFTFNGAVEATCGAARSGSTVNFSYFKTMRVTYDAYKNLCMTSFNICASDINVTTVSAVTNLVPGQPENTTLTNKVVTIDVSGVTGNLYIGLRAVCDWISTGNTGQLFITNLELIP